ncbi:hypothetical protein [Pseudomonas sp. Irchel 3E20]|uniref:hypothetical protein n=1 Tax=Pseudomonas sp. Irchel 3E20 TaxID=2008983 RepID=UPI000BA328AE|nr:hypothetical protein [Pseudomonas sp. Irchel 3E20]
MARREFAQFEAVSAAVRGEEGYHAAIAVKGLGASGAPRFHKVLAEQTFNTALAADEAAEQSLALLGDVDDEGELVWRAI